MEAPEIQRSGSIFTFLPVAPFRVVRKNTQISKEIAILRILQLLISFQFPFTAVFGRNFRLFGQICAIVPLCRIVVPENCHQ